MANPFDSDDIEILEGFLCPICREDLKTPERLTEHVEKQHADEQDVLKSIKEIFSKAKRKIKFNFDETVDLAKSLDNNLKISNQTNLSYYTNFLNTTPQDVGVDYSHFSYFNAIRTPRLERYASETNKLIIRLHKLLKNRPVDQIQQKLHDQKTVPWLDGTSVKLCPNCARSFHLARRQHHCRLCGSIMCHDCSQFLDYEDAESLISIAISDDNDETNDEKSTIKGQNNSNTIRTCEHCIRLLDTRKEMQDSHTCRPTIVKLYEDIQELKKNIKPDIEMYIKMINSLYDGDSIFTINDVSALKGKIGRVAEIIDLKTKQILALPSSQQQHQQQNTREDALKKSIRMACVKYIKDEMLSIPPIPVEDEIRKIQEKRRKETEQKIERERRLALEAYEKYGLSESNTVYTMNSNFASGSAVATLDNWSGIHQVTSNNVNDPLVEQINIIKSYIKQARAAMRFDEVATLELNLRELQNEFYQRHQQQQQQKQQQQQQ